MGQPGIIMWFFHLGSDGATAFQHHPIIETSFSALSALLRTKRIWLIHLVDLLAQKSHLRSKKESSCLLCFTSLCHSAGLDSLPCYESAGMKRNTAAYDIRQGCTTYAHEVRTIKSNNLDYAEFHFLLYVTVAFDPTG